MTEELQDSGRESRDEGENGAERETSQGDPGAAAGEKNCDDEPTAGNDIEEILPARSGLFAFVNQDTSERLDVFLTDRLPGRSRGYVQRLIEDGYVALDPPPRREPRPSLKVPAGTTVRVRIPPPVEVTLTPEDIPIEFLYEDQYFAVINKPPGLAVHPNPSQSSHTLVNALLYWLKGLSSIAGVERPGIVHRLDKDTSGVLVVAKNDFAHQAIASQFKDRKVHKRYLAIARGQPSRNEGRIDYNLGRSIAHSKKMMVRLDGSGRTAVTDFTVLETFRGYVLVELYPATGRTHQIRVHLASEKLPVACDKLYGRERRILLSEIAGKARTRDEAPIIDRQALHAASLTLQHPVTREEMTFTAPLPDDMLALLRALQRHRSPP